MLPSEEHAIEMYPMDFEEFLWAMGDEMMMPFIKMQFEKRKPMEAFHRKALDYFRQYMIVGGMPQAVQTYVDTRDFDKVDERKRDILSIYRNDIRKYADNQETKVAAIFEELPGQLQSMRRSSAWLTCSRMLVCEIIPRRSFGFQMQRLSIAVIIPRSLVLA